jgi:hypothetical protein
VGRRGRHARRRDQAGAGGGRSRPRRYLSTGAGSPRSNGWWRRRASPMPAP